MVEDYLAKGHPASMIISCEDHEGMKLGTRRQSIVVCSSELGLMKVYEERKTESLEQHLTSCVR